MFDDVNDLYQQVILDHCKKPRNFHELPQCSCSAQGHNPLCGDQLKLFLTLDGEVIREALGLLRLVQDFSAERAAEIVKQTWNRDMLQRWLDEETRHKVKRTLTKQIKPLLNESKDEDND